ncbi:MAG: CDP-diacylglycerol--glycerol-3-phosphate 3-phosphatidyltransferase [Verrucomicrobiales bacterium]|jgi:CDP-diacylglycerol--glycerol-3-phosphate 3-phosphatidyltransferase
MTLANKITVTRGLLIPVFVGFTLYYGQSLEAEEPVAWLRIAAIFTFVVAALGDALDGWIARRFNQQTELGKILDPLVDKALMLTAIITLSFARWEPQLPLWFAILVIARDTVNPLGFFLTNHLSPGFKCQPHWTGKTATAMQMITICWALFAIPLSPVWIAAAAGFFTLISSAIYLIDGVRHLQRSGHAHPNQS